MQQINNWSQKIWDYYDQLPSHTGRNIGLSVMLSVLSGSDYKTRLVYLSFYGTAALVDNLSVPLFRKMLSRDQLNLGENLSKSGITWAIASVVSDLAGSDPHFNATVTACGLCYTMVSHLAGINRLDDEDSLFDRVSI